MRLIININNIYTNNSYYVLLVRLYSRLAVAYIRCKDVIQWFNAPLFK